MAVFDVLHGIREGSLDPVFSTILQVKKQNYFIRLTKNNDISLQEIHKKEEFVQAIQVLARDSSYVVRFFRIM